MDDEFSTIIKYEPRKKRGQGGDDVIRPRIVLEQLSDDQIGVMVQWPKTGNVEDGSHFAHSLLLLQQGKLLTAICDAIAKAGNVVGEPEKAMAIAVFLQENIKPQKVRDPNRPVVLPSQVVKHNMKPYE